MEEYGAETFGELFSDVYDTWYGTKLAEETTQASVQVLADLAAGGTVLELAIGTGRVALTLAAQGLSVHGIDASEAMVAKLREKPGGDRIPVVIGDFGEVSVDGAFDLIYVIFNTLFNLTSQDDQVRCFQNVAHHLTAGGLFVVEAFVPDISGFVDNQAVRTVHLTTDSAYLEASVHDPVRQTVQYQYIEITQEGARLYPVPMRYAWPSELDLMARLAGLELRERWGGWDCSPFTASSSGHVSVYGRTESPTSHGAVLPPDLNPKRSY
jgi:SAM-dependent methyltransferase